MKLKIHIGRWSRPVAALLLAATLAVGIYFGLSHTPNPAAGSSIAQTDVDRAEHLVDAKGVPLLKIAGIGEQRHPAWIAIYALAYAGVEVYDPKLANLKNAEKFDACIAWLEQNLKQQPNGLWVWEYGFDNTYNDISIKAPWSSAFAQATGIQAFLAAYKKTGNDKYLTLAKKSAQSLFTPLEQGGFLFQSGSDIWFEEIPQPTNNPSHILNGHMRVLLALKELADATGDATLANWLKRGTDTLYRWLPRYDAGYWVRYDLNPQKKELLFRLANPYGFANHPLAVDKITLRDPVSKQEVILDIGSPSDAVGANRIAGTHWGQIAQIEGRSVRRLIPAALENKPDEMAAPHSYFYLSLPGEWKNNLRDQWYEMAVEYYDDAAANITVQQRAVSPGPTFRDMRDGDLHLTGAGQWRKWIVPVRPTDLGYWVGASYADKHWRYLAKIAEWDARFQSWAQVAKGYLNAATAMGESGEKVSPSPIVLPKQTPMLPIFSLDQDGVVKQHVADNQTRLNADGTFDPTGSVGTPVYSPYIIAEQLLSGDRAIGSVYKRPDVITRKPALKWLLDPANSRQVKGSNVYFYGFGNVYNDVVTKASWTSAFGQSYVLKALVHAAENEFANTRGLPDATSKAATAFTVPVAQGGIAAKDRSGAVWYEEVPNGTHVLNAHLVSMPELSHAARYLRAPHIQSLADAGIQSLRDKLHLFDTGYWLRSDQNPKKELLLQIDWLDGEASPLIDEVLLQNPQTGRTVRLDVGEVDDAEVGVRLSGAEWQAAQTIGGKTVRAFTKGYPAHAQPVPGGTRHNVYLVLQLPDREFADDFDVPSHRLIVRYKDVAKGRFAMKIQAINQGNHLTFIPLRGGVWRTQGDQRWKEAAFTLRPQDMGWYKGPDYQRYEVEQIQRIANLTNDWFFYQYADRHRHFLEMQQKGETVIKEGEAKQARASVTLKVIAASETYPGYGFDNSLDGNPNDDYTAGIENKPGYIVVALDRPAKLAAVRLHWESERNLAQRVVISEANPDKSAGRVLADVSDVQGQVSSVPLNNADAVKAIRIDFHDFIGQPRILLRQIKVIEAASDIAVQDPIDPKAIFLGAQDPRNPLHLFRLPITQRIKHLSDELSAGANSEHEKILRFMRYIGQFRVGVASDASPDTTVDEQIGACGDFTNTLLALASAQGMNGRYVNLYNYPLKDGHTVAEVFVDGKWRLYDATYGSYYYSARDQKAMPLSFEEIKNAFKYGNHTIKQEVMTPRPGLEGFTGRNIFRKAMPAGIVGPNRPMIFPLSLDLVDFPTVDENRFGTETQGAEFLGAAGANQNQEWRISGLAAGEQYVFIITPKHLGGDIESNDKTFRLQASVKNGGLMGSSEHVFDFSSGSAEPWRMRFKANGSVVVLTLTHPYRGPDFRYMTMANYMIERADKDKK